MIRGTIAITAHRRPQYLFQVVQSWGKANDGHRWPVLFQCEPVMPEIWKICKDAQVNGPKFVFVNSDVKGALGNPYEALKTAFYNDPTEFVVLGEDDSVVSPDILAWMTWAATHFYNDKGVLAVCSFVPQTYGAPDKYLRRHWFASTVWGTWRDRWENWMEPNWGFDYGDPAWDRKFVDLCAHDDMTCIFPAQSRSHHIGRHEGTHMNQEMFDEFPQGELYVGPEFGRFKYMEVPQ